MTHPNEGSRIEVDTDTSTCIGGQHKHAELGTG
jgi:hypothetical protein